MKKFISPLFVMIPRKTKKDKKVSLNLNVYRNLNYIVNNQAKSMYCEIMADQMKGVRFDIIDIEFVLFKSSKRKIDRANFLSIVEKFFCDALVHQGCIKDDNDDFINSTKYLTGGIDKDNPRVEIYVLDRSYKND